MINSKSITLFAASWLDQLKPTSRVIQLCTKIFPYFDEVVHINTIVSSKDYNKFMVEDLHKFVKTDFVMTVQADGHTINPPLWRDDFLNYDYIGAPWWSYGVCGNGGFSLRSSKFLRATSEIKYSHLHSYYEICPEDVFLCMEDGKRDLLISNGIKFADMHTAFKFSFEKPTKDLPKHTIKDSFGFHGKDNLPAPIFYKKDIIL